MLRRLFHLLPDDLREKWRPSGPARRRSIAMAYYRDVLDRIETWSGQDRELSNFYYELTPLNKEHLAHLVEFVTGVPYASIREYFEELAADGELRAHLRQGLVTSSYGRDIQIEYGRRLGWYAFARATKPKIVIETGVDHGVGSCVLASALLRNAAEGYPGRYYGTDINTKAGQLFAGKYASVGEILYGDSLATLEAFPGKIDLFINDSDHSTEYEYREYRTIAGKLTENGLILGDNSHGSDSLSRFARESGRPFVFFSEKPHEHWYPGAGIGISPARGRPGAAI